MGVQLFTNWASATLASPITSTATSLSLTSGEGALFPNPSGGDWFVGTLTKADQPASSASEIVQVTARATDALTVVRAQEGTTAQAWAAGDQFQLLNTAGTMNELLQLGNIVSTGSFGVTLSGPWSSGLTGTLYYSIRAGLVSLWAIAQISATATSSLLISLTLPAVITPTTYKVVVCSGVLNGGSGWGELRVANSGASTLAASNYASAPPPYSVGAGAFDSGKSAGIDVGFNAVYSLD